MSTVQAGFIFSGSVGTGIFMRRNPVDGSWSNPVAVGISGVGFGLLLGAQLKDVVLFLPDDLSIQTLFSTGVELSAQSNVTAVIGREFEGSFGVSGSGSAAVVSMAYSKGAFIGASMHGGVVGPRHRANEAFYGQPVKPVDIIEGKVDVPIEKQGKTLLDDVKAKLTKCANGQTEIPGAETVPKSDAALKDAEAASEALTVSARSEIVQVDINAEAAKETA